MHELISGPVFLEHLNQTVSSTQPVLENGMELGAEAGVQRAAIVL